MSTTLIQIPSWGSATLIELIWTSIGFAVVLLTLLSLPDIVRDWAAALRSGSELIETLALSYIRREILRNVQGAVIAAIGVYVSVTPSLAPGPAVTTVSGLILTVGLLAIGFITGLQSFLDRRTRHRVRAMIELEETATS